MTIDGYLWLPVEISTFRIGMSHFLAVTRGVTRSVTRSNQIVKI